MLASSMPLQAQEGNTKGEALTIIFVSPTEPKPLRDIGIVTPHSEEYGCDIYWTVNDKKYGVQRKEFPNDFLASVHDGRLGEQINKGGGLDMMVLLLEGKDHWTNDGRLIRANGGSRYGWTRTQHRNFLASVQQRGCQVQWSDGLYDTISCVQDLVAWSGKEDHTSLDRRTGAAKDKWGRRSNLAWQKHFIQGIPGVGPKQAAAIMEMHGFPFKLTISRELLGLVPGIGKKTVDKIFRIFDEAEHVDDSPVA